MEFERKSDYEEIIDCMEVWIENHRDILEQGPHIPDAFHNMERKAVKIFGDIFAVEIGSQAEESQEEFYERMRDYLSEMEDIKESAEGLARREGYEFEDWDIAISRAKVSISEPRYLQ